MFSLAMGEGIFSDFVLLCLPGARWVGKLYWIVMRLRVQLGCGWRGDRREGDPKLDRPRIKCMILTYVFVPSNVFYCNLT